MTPPIVKRYLIALGRYKWVIPVTTALGLAGAGVVAMQPLPETTYRAGGTLSYESPPVSFTATGSQIQQQGQELTEDLLLAEDLIKKAVSKVDPNLKPSRVRQGIKIDLPKDPPAQGNNAQAPRLIQLAYVDTNSQRGVALLSALMQEMVVRSREINKSRLKAVIESIRERVPQAQQELKGAEQVLEQYDKREGPAILAAQNGSLIGAITNAQAQRRQFQQNLDGVNAQIQSLEQKLGLSVDEAYVSSALSADPIIANLRTQIYTAETQLATLSKDLRPEHPTMINLIRQKESYEQLLQARAQEVLSGGGTAAPLPSVTTVRQGSNLDPTRQQLANTLVGLQTQQETLRQQIASTYRDEQALRRDYSSIPNKQLERARLEQQVTLKKALYDKMQDKLVDAQAAEAETVSSLNIAKPADIVKEEKATKNVPLTLGAGVLIGLLLGGGLVFLLDMLEGTFYTVEDIKDALKQRDVVLLGVLPLVDAPSHLNRDVPILVEPDSPYLDFYERWRSNLRRVEGQAIRVVLLTSTLQDEGKTISAYNLAIASARAGKRTLLVEADLRSPSKVRSLKISPDPDSLVEPLRYYSQLSDCIRLVPEVENLYVVPSPGPQRQAAAIIESSEIRRLLEDVRGRFDLVILDTPALSLNNDALLLEPYTDGIVLTARPGYTKSSLLAESIDQLTESEDFRLLGAIINGADVVMPHKLEAGDPTNFLEEFEEIEDEDYEEVTAGSRNS
jgi:capsular exopolysaccharide synthesis family protein